MPIHRNPLAIALVAERAGPTPPPDSGTAVSPRQSTRSHQGEIHAQSPDQARVVDSSSTVPADSIGDASTPDPHRLQYRRGGAAVWRARRPLARKLETQRVRLADARCGSRTQSRPKFALISKLCQCGCRADAADIRPHGQGSRSRRWLGNTRQRQRVDAAPAVEHDVAHCRGIKQPAARGAMRLQREHDARADDR
jgi:hypothetical protein